MNIYKRLKSLCAKLLSFKFVIFLITCLMRMAKFIDGTEWVTVAVVTLAGHVGMKYVHTVQGDIL